MHFGPNLTRSGLAKASQKEAKTKPRRTQNESKIESKIEAKKLSKNGPPKAPRVVLTITLLDPEARREGGRGEDQSINQGPLLEI